MKIYQSIFIVSNLIFSSSISTESSFSLAGLKELTEMKATSNNKSDIGKIIGTSFGRSMLYSALSHAIETNLFTRSSDENNCVISCYGCGAMSGAMNGCLLPLAAKLGSYPTLSAKELNKPMLISLIASCLALIPSKLNAMGSSSTVFYDADLEASQKSWEFYMVSNIMQWISISGLCLWAIAKRADKDTRAKLAKIAQMKEKLTPHTKVMLP